MALFLETDESISKFDLELFILDDLLIKELVNLVDASPSEVSIFVL